MPKTTTTKTYERRLTNPFFMGCGGKGKPKRVIDGAQLYEYVGIGWIAIRDATKADRKRYPILVD